MNAGQGRCHPGHGLACGGRAAVRLAAAAAGGGAGPQWSRRGPSARCPTANLNRRSETPEFTQ